MRRAAPTADPRRLFGAAALSLAMACMAWGQPGSGNGDPILKAMEAELERSAALQLAEMEKPYFIEYALDDVRSFSVSATLGALVAKDGNHFRVPRVSVRVGSYEFDNTNYALSGMFSRGAGMQPPLDANVPALRTAFWLATDGAYKGALEAIARKRSALKNVAGGEQLDDFWPAEPVTILLEAAPRPADDEWWTARVKELSAIVGAVRAVTSSRVNFEDTQSVSYIANTEGTRVRYPDNLQTLRIRAEGQAPDGMIVRDAVALGWLEDRARPGESEARRQAEMVARNVAALAEAPVGEAYAGPVLFEQEAAAQLLAQLLAANLAAPRRPVSEPGRPAPFQASEFEGRIGARVLPEWMDVVDDPTQKEWRGRPLFGHYAVDMEGVVPKPLKLVEKGVLKDFLLTRQPVKGRSGSNGRARIPGRHGANAAAIGNLFVKADKTSTSGELRKQLLELCGQRERPYGMVVRKLDFPTSAGPDEIRQWAGGDRGGSQNLFSRPVLAYRLYPDGREELVRGLQFRGVSTRLLRDIVAASDETWLFEYLGSLAPLSMMGAGGYVTAGAVVAPSLLFDDVELVRGEQELPRLPVAPPPARGPR
ncbi:MAG: hypothetical protein KIT09_02770 [Bryobacteraceae bacterium]|nr:hypothetical protein [Bryobacteraceae bacterium]